jgi:hypothetical protein
MKTNTPATPSISRENRIKSALSVAVAIVVLVGAMVFYSTIRGWFRSKPVEIPPAKPVVTLVAGTTDALQVDEAVTQRLGIRVAEAKVAAIADTLKLNGSLTLDAAHFARSPQSVRW